VNREEKNIEKGISEALQYQPGSVKGK